VWLLIVRFRALPPNEAKVYTQEIVNHFFLDAESRMRDRFGISTSRLVKGYMRDLHQQQRGSVLGFDEGLAHSESDARLAAALWRNVWGQGWGVVGGVKRKVTGIDRTNKGEDPSEEGSPELARDRAAPVRADAEPELVLGSPPSPLEFPEHLQRLVQFVRSETHRRAQWSDADVRQGKQAGAVSLGRFEEVVA
jgi:cytochrome b pre-mRNA-processing protein 3